MYPETADDIGKLILRLTLGLLILLHGIGKLTGGLEGVEGMLTGAGLPAFIAYGAYLGEVVGPLLLIIGWYARVGAGLIAINMLFAIGLAFGDQLFQLNDFGGWAIELEAIYLFSAVAIAFTGPGRLGLNQR